MEVFKQPGIALNFNYYKKVLTGSIPSILTTILPSEWVAVGDQFRVRRTNTLYTYGPGKYLVFRESDGTLCYMIVTEDPYYITLLSEKTPQENLVLAGVPVNHTTSQEFIVNGSDFTLQTTAYGDRYGVNLPLADGKLPYAIESVTNDSDALTVYLNALCTETQISLYAIHQPTIPVKITVQYLA